MSFSFNDFYSPRKILCKVPEPKHIYNPITAVGFLAMFPFQLDNTKRYTLPAPHCRNGSCRHVRAEYYTSTTIFILKTPSSICQ